MIPKDVGEGDQSEANQLITASGFNHLFVSCGMTFFPDDS